MATISTKSRVPSSNHPPSYAGSRKRKNKCFSCKFKGTHPPATRAAPRLLELVTAELVFQYQPSRPAMYVRLWVEVELWMSRSSLPGTIASVERERTNVEEHKLLFPCHQSRCSHHQHRSQALQDGCNVRWICSYLLSSVLT